jgi:hypothetical protein
VQCSPLLLGIVGQRDIAAADEPRVADAVRSIVLELRASYPHTDIVVVSALQQRSERAAADAARAEGAELLTIDDDARRWSAIAVPQLVLLVSDGDESRAEIVDAVNIREGRARPEASKPLVPPDVGPYYQIVLPAAPSEVAAGACEIVRRFPERHPGDAQSEADFVKALLALDRYNRDLASQFGASAAQSLEDAFVQTDTLAARLQSHTIRWQGALYAVALFAAAIQVVTPSANWEWKVSAIALTLLIFILAKRSGAQSRYQDYRAIAEALRVQLAWWNARIDASVDGAYLRMQQSELQWIRMLLRVVTFLHRPASLSTGESQSPPLDLWIGDQRAYFEVASNREVRRLGRIMPFASALVPCTIVVSLGVGIFLAAWHGDASLAHRLQFGTGIFAAMGAVLAALLTSYSRARMFGENAKRYRRMYLLFDEARRELHAAVEAKQSATVRELALVLGHEALSEQAEWLLTQRDRPVGIVQTAAAQF